MTTLSNPKSLVWTAITEGVELAPAPPGHSEATRSPFHTSDATPSQETPADFPGTKPARSGARYDLRTASIEFEATSCLGTEHLCDKDYLTADKDKAMSCFLAKEYNAVLIDTADPFMVIGCRGGFPPMDQRPFSVSGYIAIWRNMNDMNFYPIFAPDGYGPAIEIDERVAKHFHIQEAPPQDAVLYLAQHVFPECIAISQILTDLIIERPPVSFEQFKEDLQALPKHIKGINMNLAYHNGPLPGTGLQQRTVDLEDLQRPAGGDATDYVEGDGSFLPGSMITSVGADSEVLSVSNAGVLVERDGAKRLVCASDDWDQLDQLEQLPSTESLEPREPAIHQGRSTDTLVGHMTSEGRGEPTGLSLARLLPDVQFENVFVEMPYRPKTLLHSSQVHCNDDFIFDACNTGRMRLKRLGRRFEMIRNGAEIERIQPRAIFASNSPFLGGPNISGAPLLRCKADRVQPNRQQAGEEGEGDVGDEGKEEDPHRILSRGEVAGFVHYSPSPDPLWSAPSPSQAKFYLCYAEFCDALVEDGWGVSSK